MAFESARMSARKCLFAWTITSWLHLSAFDWWIHLGDTARTEQRFSGVNSAWLAVAKMAKVIALVCSTSQSLVARLQTDVMAFRVSSALFNRAADLLALVFLASLHLIANLCASEGVSHMLLLVCQQLVSDFVGIVNCKARHLSAIFAASAVLINHDVASLAFAFMTLLHALMLTTGKELLAFVRTQRNRISAGFPVSSDQLLD